MTQSRPAANGIVQVRSQDQEQQYELARILTLERDLDLELIHKNNDAQFYVERRVLKA